MAGPPAKMQQSILQARGSGLCEPPNQEVWTTGNKVDLSHDKVSELPQYPDCPSLVALYLQGNSELIAIPPLFFQHMALLQVLDLSNTSIKSLPKSLPKLIALKKLMLRGCQLFMELSPQVGELENLEQLDLDKTQIMDLPREIGKLVSLRHLRVSFYRICGNKKSKSNIVIHPETISNLSQLTDVHIDVDPADKRWDDSVEAVVKELCNSKIRLRTLSLYLPKFQSLEYMSSIYPSLSRFRFIVGHIKRRIISRVPQEVEAEFRNWHKCLKFVNGENIPTEIKGVLGHSSSFFLDRHTTAMNLYEFGIENMKRLKYCLLAECNQMETIIDGEWHGGESEDDLSKSDPSCVQNVVLESLEYLNIFYMENLGSISRGQSLYGCMSKLKFLALHTCPRLINVLSHALLENLFNLEEFILEDCPLVTSLVSHPSAKPKMTDKFLPSLKRLLLLYLPALVCVSNGLSIAPKLESIGFYNCPKLKSISKMELSSKTLKIIKGERRWWEDMNWNETEWGNRPEYLMRIFSPINNEGDVMTQMAEDGVLFEARTWNEGQQQLVTSNPVDDNNSFGYRAASKRGVCKSSASSDSAKVSIPRTRLVYDAALERKGLGKQIPIWDECSQDSQNETGSWGSYVPTTRSTTIVTNGDPLERVERLASKNAVVIFSKSSCSMSHSIKTLLCGMGVNPTVYELDEVPGGKDMERALMSLGSCPAVPAVFIGGKLVGGANRVLASHINGTLIPLLRQSCALWI